MKRAELGSVLEPEELQHIQTTVQAFASMKDFTTEMRKLRLIWLNMVRS